MWEEFQYITELIESCQIPIELNHFDSDPKNMLYDAETNSLTIIDYDNVDTQIFTLDLGRYIAGYVGIPLDFTKLPDDARLKQFVGFYLEEKFQLLKKPDIELTDEVFAKYFYWVELSYTFVIFTFLVNSLWFHLYYDLSETPLPDTNMFRKFTLPSFTEYYRMKNKLHVHEAEFETDHK